MEAYKVIENTICGLTGEQMGGNETFDSFDEAEAYYFQMVSDAFSSYDDTQVIFRDQKNMKTLCVYKNYED